MTEIITPYYQAPEALRSVEKKNTEKNTFAKTEKAIRNTLRNLLCKKANVQYLATLSESIFSPSRKKIYNASHMGDRLEPPVDIFGLCDRSKTFHCQTPVMHLATADADKALVAFETSGAAPLSNPDAKSTRRIAPST